MTIITIPYTDNFKLNIIGSTLLTVALIVASTFSAYFLFGLVLPIMILTNRSGLQIDVKNNVYREYSKIFTRIKGEWKSLSNFKNIVIKSQSATKSTTGTRMTADLKVKTVIHSICLMDYKHLQQLFLKSFEDYDKAKLFADNLSKDLNFSIETFRPLTARTGKARQ